MPRKPAEKGNSRALQHGAGAKLPQNLPDPSVEVAEIVAGLPFKGPDGGALEYDRVAAEQAGATLALTRQIRAWLAKKGPIAATDEVRPVVRELQRQERLLSEQLAALGMTPRSRAALGVDVQRGFDLAKHWQEEGNDAA